MLNPARRLFIARLTALTCAAVVAASLAGSASADPDALTFTLFNCTGSAGTPSTIPIEKEAGGLALHVVGATSTFKIVSEDGLVLAQGFDNNGQELVACDAIKPNGDFATFTGLLTPAST